MDDRFRSDELHFTGADLGRRSNRNKYAYQSDSESTASEEDSEDNGTANMQVALRGKEDLLYEKALARIRRAQELGKKSVELSKSELEALQRKQQKDADKQVKSKQKERKKSGQKAKKSSKKENRKDSKRIELPLEQYDNLIDSRRPPGMLVTGKSGQQSFAPVGYQQPLPITLPRGSKSSSRNTSSSNLNRKSPEMTRRGERRHSKPPSPRSPDSVRSLPDDPNWMPPRARSSSTLSGAPYYADPNHPYQYQTYSPPMPQIPPQYSSTARRIVSNPQPSSRERQPRYEGSDDRYDEPRRRRRHSPSESSSSSDDGSDAGVHVDLSSPYDGRGNDYRSISDPRGGRK